MDWEEMEEVDKFKYLGVMISENGEILKSLSKL